MSIPKETSAPVAKSASAKKMLMGDLMQTVGILPILILIVAVFGFIAPNFFTESNLLNITRQASINIVLAAGMTFIILTGGIDLSVGSILGTTAVAAMVVSLNPGVCVAVDSGGADARPAARPVQRRAGRLRRAAAVYRHPRHLHGAARRRLSAGRRHHGDQLRYQLRVDRQ
ncbi:ribose ABC transporter permease RbsC [Klebsiella pneumoniae]|nr:ribose ABC transporter permease RbsC [Klebsiella pneumoniae]